MDIPSNWTFETPDIAEGFDTHVREQLPWYDLATNAVAHIARHYIPQNGLVYDIGASTGNIGKAIKDTLDSRDARLVAVESSLDMVKLYSGPGEVFHANALDFNFQKYDVAVAFLLFMFLPVGHRRTLFNNLIRSLKPGGCFIIFDKTEIKSGYISTVLHRLTLAGKLAQGAKPEHILQKELSLCGVQRPLPGHFIKDLAPEAIEVFRFGEFAGWIVEREE